MSASERARAVERCLRQLQVAVGRRDLVAVATLEARLSRIAGTSDLIAA